MEQRIIFHIDVNSAFLSWEACYRLHHLGGKVDLREQVAAVGGDVTMRHGIILAKSIPAKQYNIKTGESLMEARQKCPDLIIVPPNYNLYEKCSVAFIKILREYSDMVEQYSIDEAFVDMTATCHLFGTPEETAHIIKNRIRNELGFTVNIGISTNKLLAKMASDFKKPDKVHTLYPFEIERKMWPLSVSDLFFVGHATTKKLFTMGIHTIGELAKCDPAWLRTILKKHGEVVWSFANGIDLSPVITEPPANKGYGNSTTSSVKNYHDKSQPKRYDKLKMGTKTSAGIRTIPINDSVEELLTLLQEYDARNGIISPYVVCTSTGKRGNARNLQRSLDRILSNVDMGELPHKVTLHTLRHTFGSAMLRKGAPISVVSALLGHSSTVITYRKYIHVIQDEKISAVNKIQIV